MSNFRLLIKNELDKAVLSATNEVATLPVDNLKKESKSDVFRTNASTTTIIGTFASHILADMFCIGRYSYSPLAEVVLTLKSSGVVVYSKSIVSDLGLKPLGEWIVGVDPFGLPSEDIDHSKLLSYITFDRIIFDEFQLQITNTEPFDIGRLYLGLSFSPEHNFDYGYNLRHDDDISHVRMSDGSLRSLGGSEFRMATINLSFLNDSDRGLLEGQMLTKNRTNEFVYIAYPEAVGIKAAINTMMCKFADPLDLTHNFYNNNTNQLALIEN